MPVIDTVSVVMGASGGIGQVNAPQEQIQGTESLIIIPTAPLSPVKSFPFH